MLLLIIVCYSSCKSSKSDKVSKTKTSKQILKTTEFELTEKTTKPTLTLPDSITNYAKTFEGVKYKWGGTTKLGMDCSGLVFESFRAHHIFLPRISRDIAKKGLGIALKDVKKGDLLFFKTGKSKRQAINHVGLIIEVTENDIAFIHATNKSGVIISNLSETYWRSTFFEARRYL